MQGQPFTLVAGVNWTITVSAEAKCFYADVAGRRIVGTADADGCKQRRPFVCQV